METVRSYGQKKTLVELQIDLLLCVQHKDEKNEDYVTRCETLYRLACSAVRNKYTDLATSNALISGLNEVAQVTLKNGTTSTKLYCFILKLYIQKLSFEEFIDAIEEFLRDERYYQKEWKQYRNARALWSSETNEPLT